MSHVLISRTTSRHREISISRAFEEKVLLSRFSRFLGEPQRHTAEETALHTNPPLSGPEPALLFAWFL